MAFSDVSLGQCTDYLSGHGSKGFLFPLLIDKENQGLNSKTQALSALQMQVIMHVKILVPGVSIQWKNVLKYKSLPDLQCDTIFLHTSVVASEGGYPHFYSPPMDRCPL